MLIVKRKTSYFAVLQFADHILLSSIFYDQIYLDNFYDYDHMIQDSSWIWKLKTVSISKMKNENNFQIREIDFQNGIDEDDA